MARTEPVASVHAVQYASARTTGAGLRGTGTPCTRREAEADHRRRLGYPASSTSRGFARSRIEVGVFMVDMAFRRLSRRSCSQPAAACACRTRPRTRPARPRGAWSSPTTRHRKRSTPLSSRPARRSVDACDRRKAAAFGEALRPEFKVYRKRCRTTPRPCGHVEGKGVDIVSGGTDSH